MSYKTFGNGKVLLGDDAYRAVRDEYLATAKIPSSESADDTLIPSLETLHSASAHTVRNDPIGSAAISVLTNGVVGGGLRPHPQVDHNFLGISEEEAQEFGKKASELWDFWANSKACDYSARETFSEMERTIFRSSLEYGDVFAVKRNTKKSFFGLCIQPIEATRIKTPDAKFGESNIKAGIELDSKTGSEKAIHVEVDRLEGKFRRISVRDKFGKKQVLHPAHRKRISQCRGTPLLTNVMNILGYLSKLTEGELTAATLNSFIAFTTNTKYGDSPLPDGGIIGLANKTRRELPNQIRPGSNIHLGEGESVNVLDSKRPNQLYEPFFLALVRQVGAEIGIPANVLLNHFDASYSASKAALQTAYQTYKQYRKWFVANFHTKIWDFFVSEMIERGHLKCSHDFSHPLIRRAYLNCEWVGDSGLQHQIDPLKEANSAKVLLELGIVSKKHLAQTLLGLDYDKVAAQIRSETSGGDIINKSEG